MHNPTDNIAHTMAFATRCAALVGGINPTTYYITSRCSTNTIELHLAPWAKGDGQMDGCTHNGCIDGWFKGRMNSMDRWMDDGTKDADMDGLMDE